MNNDCGIPIETTIIHHSTPFVHVQIFDAYERKWKSIIVDVKDLKQIAEELLCCVDLTETIDNPS